MASVEPGSRASAPFRRSLPFAGIALVATVVAGVVLVPQTASAVPSWSDVQAAKGNAAKTKTQVQAITASLDGLQTKAAASSLAAVQADSENATAQTALASATSAADALTTQLTAEKKKASQAHQEAGQLAAHLYRIGNSESLQGQLFSGRGATSTLYKLGALSQLTAQWQTVLDEATVASKSVSSLSSQATVAAAERDRLAKTAADALATAQSAQQTANAEVASATTEQATLYSQLASLNNTTATLEKGYREHQIAIAGYRAQLVDKHNAQIKKDADARAAALAEAAKANPPSSSGASSSGASGGSGSDTGGSSTPPAPPPSGAIDDPAGAQAYARSALPSHGWDSSQFQCLVLLWNQESGWRTSALNVSSGAYGIPQSLPGNKMATAGFDWQTNYRTQITWGLGYIAAAYGSPCGAWAHEGTHNWY